jgi:hypothetical protein
MYYSVKCSQTHTPLDIENKNYAKAHSEQFGSVIFANSVHQFPVGTEPFSCFSPSFFFPQNFYSKFIAFYYAGTINQNSGNCSVDKTVYTY